MLLSAPRIAALLAAAQWAACAPKCTVFIGDRNLPVEAVLIASTPTDALSDILAGATVQLEPPPQGGYVTYAGARVKNVAAGSCDVTFAGSLREPSTGTEVGFDRRQSKLVVDANGFGVPEAPAHQNVPNINPCPDYGPTDAHDRTLTLEMNITDAEGRTGFISTPVVPRCQLSDPGVEYNCNCTCSANYFLGKCNFGDGGNDLAGTD